MNPYIDLQQTVSRLNEAYKFVQQLVADGGTLLFVGTKKQAQEAVAEEARRCGMYYVNQRWLGGMLTNFKTIQLRITYLRELEASSRIVAISSACPRRRSSTCRMSWLDLSVFLGGIKDMRRLPSAFCYRYAKGTHGLYWRHDAWNSNHCSGGYQL